VQKKWVRVVFRRRVFVISILLAQIFLWVYLVAGTGRISRYVDWVLNILSILVCLYITGKKEKSAYKLTWIFIILMFPLFGGILYIIFYTQSNPRKLRRRIAEDNRKCRPLYVLPGNALPVLEAAREECLPQVRYLQNYAGFPVYVHTQTEYFPSGEAFFERALRELKKAEHYIFLEFFILRQGVMLDPIIEILERKARQGVDVRLI
jgi:cardiolipin synthase